MAAEWLLQRRYSFLLVALFLLFVLHPIVYEVALGQWVYDVLFTLVFLAAFQFLFRRMRYRLVTVLLGVPTVAATWTGYVVPGIPSVPLTVAFHLFATLFLGLAVAAILQATHEAKAVSADTLAGAFCGYVLVGVVFGHLYCIVDALAPGSFVAQAELAANVAAPERRRFLLTYYSFMTLTTVGYGDIMPASAPARSLACLEALLGQFYIAVVMAELIGLKVSRHVGGPPQAPEDT